MSYYWRLFSLVTSPVIPNHTTWYDFPGHCTVLVKIIPRHVIFAYHHTKMVWFSRVPFRTVACYYLVKKIIFKYLLKIIPSLVWFSQGTNLMLSLFQDTFLLRLCTEVLLTGLCYIVFEYSTSFYLLSRPFFIFWHYRRHLRASTVRSSKKADVPYIVRNILYRYCKLYSTVPVLVDTTQHKTKQHNKETGPVR
jgi:hypothetical protein